jgi:hypothetical protein
LQIRNSRRCHAQALQCFILHLPFLCAAAACLHLGQMTKCFLSRLLMTRPRHTNQPTVYRKVPLVGNKSDK